MKNYSNATQKENDNSPDTKLRVTTYCHLTDREFRKAVRRKLHEIQENTGKTFNELRNKIND